MGVVSFSSDPKTPPGSMKTSFCYQDTLAKATSINKAYLKRYVKNLIAVGGTNYTKAFKKAFELMGKAEKDKYDTRERGIGSP